MALDADFPSLREAVVNLRLVLFIDPALDLGLSIPHYQAQR